MDNKREKILKIINNPLVQSILYSRFLDYHQWSILTFVKKCANQVKLGEKIIDLGAGELRYKKYFSHAQYVSQDLGVGDKQWNFNSIDIRSSIYEIPVQDQSFDYILCTQVLEHLEFPEKAFHEFRRILKSGGKAFVTVSLGQGEHQIPYDYYRYTQYVLRGLGERNGLRLINIVPQGGIFMNLKYMLWQSFTIFIPFKNNILIRYIIFALLLPFKFISGLFFSFFDLFDIKKHYTNNYSCIYEKT